MDDARIHHIQQLRARLDAIQKEADAAREALHNAVRDAFPENHGQRPRRGLVNQIAHAAGWTREYTARVRDSGPTSPPTNTP